MRKLRRPLTRFQFFIALYFYKHFEFDESNADNATIHAFVANIDPTLPPTNDFVEHAGDAAHNLAVRAASTAYVDKHTPLFGVTKDAAIEFLYEWMIKNDTMGRLFASGGLDPKVFKLNKEQDAALAEYLADTTQVPPKFVSDLMEAEAWGIVRSVGWHALEVHYEANLHLVLRELFFTFEGMLNLLPNFEKTVLVDAYTRWLLYHNSDVDPDHNSMYLEELRKVPVSELQAWLEPVKGILQRPHPESCTSDFHQFPLAFLGFDRITYALRFQIDDRWSQTRVSIAGGAAFGTIIQRMILCDESLSLLVKKANFDPWASTAAPELVAQRFSAAVAEVYQNNRKAAEDMLDTTLGVLLRFAVDVARTFGLHPEMPDPPYSLVNTSTQASELTSSSEDGVALVATPSSTAQIFQGFDYTPSDTHCQFTYQHALPGGDFPLVFSSPQGMLSVNPTAESLFAAWSAFSSLPGDRLHNPLTVPSNTTPQDPPLLGPSRPAISLVASSSRGLGTSSHHGLMNRKRDSGVVSSNLTPGPSSRRGSFAQSGRLPPANSLSIPLQREMTPRDCPSAPTNTRLPIPVSSRGVLPGRPSSHTLDVNSTLRASHSHQVGPVQSKVPSTTPTSNALLRVPSRPRSSAQSAGTQSSLPTPTRDAATSCSSRGYPSGNQPERQSRIPVHGSFSLPSNKIQEVSPKVATSVLSSTRTSHAASNDSVLRKGIPRHSSSSQLRHPPPNSSYTASSKSDSRAHIAATRSTQSSNRHVSATVTVASSSSPLRSPSSQGSTLVQPTTRSVPSGPSASSNARTRGPINTLITFPNTVDGRRLSPGGQNRQGTCSQPAQGVRSQRKQGRDISQDRRAGRKDAT